MTLFLIDSTTELLVTIVLPDVVKTMGRPSSDSSQRYWCWQNCPKPRMELTSRLANAYKVTRPDLGVSFLRTIRPLPWSL